MPDREKVEKGLNICNSINHPCNECPYVGERNCSLAMVTDALALLKEQEAENKALRLLVAWATDCDFGFDQFPDEYERYKDEIKGMKYIDGMIHIARRTLEDHGAFEEDR